MPGVNRYLIINADDLGICSERDKGILQLFGCGAISSASLLVDGENAEAAASQATALDLPLGLHLNLTEGRAPPDSGLGDDSGQLRGKFGLRVALAENWIAASDIAAAVRAQFDRFIALTGELPSHVDGHHHIHVEPAIAEVLAPIMAREYGVYCVRLPCEQKLMQAAETLPADADFNAGFQQDVAKAAALVALTFRAEKIYSSDAFVGQSLMGYRLQAVPMAEALRSAQFDDPRGTWVELMVHPGILANDPQQGEFCRSPARAHEMAVLQSAEWQEAIAGWQLASYRDLPRPQENDRPTLLIYGKLTPATGNAETARRVAAAWAPQANIRFRPLPGEGSASIHEHKRLRELAARERLDLAFGIHVYRAGQPLAAAFSGSESTPLPFGLLASGTDANADVDIPERRAAMAEILRRADFLLCLTEDLRRRLEGLPLPDDTIVQANGIDIQTDSGYSLRASLRLGSEARLIFFPASLRRLKGVLPTIEALAETLATRWLTHFLIVLGPPLEADYAAEIETRIAALTAQYPTLAGRILRHCGLPHPDYLAALREASLLLNASDHEGLSHSIAEAMAAGVPVLVRDIAGNRELVRDGENGRLFANFSSLPQIYADCFDAPEETVRLAQRAQTEISQRYPLQAEEEILCRILQRALARRQQKLQQQ
ncbi:MAG: carbohydrate deacetylase-like isoform [Proteobacteria bacterium]|nr:carbohydrate deacetylase-like isoform [Pseudomonadota bacterium]